MKRRSFTIIVLTVLLLMTAACAKLQNPVLVVSGAAPGDKKIAVEASSFEFKPNNILAAQGDVLEIDITNTADTEHNFTIQNPEGKTLQDVDLPPRKTVPVIVPLTQTGVYEFYCDKLFHATLGMKGQVRAVPR